MTSVNKVGLGFVAAGFVGGFLTDVLGLQRFNKPLLVGFAVLCFVTIFVVSLRTRMRKPPKLN